MSDLKLAGFRFVFVEELADAWHVRQSGSLAFGANPGILLLLLGTLNLSTLSLGCGANITSDLDLLLQAT